VISVVVEIVGRALRFASGASVGADLDSSLSMNSREARNESFSFRFVLGDFIDAMESIAEIDKCEPGRKGPIPVRVSRSTG
jgi:hypothetical protein